MENGDVDPSQESRLPRLADLLLLCRLLNEAGARYLVVGGWAVIQHGLARTTDDIDILVESSPDNFSRIQKAMSTLPDNAIRHVKPGELDEFVVIRVCDEFTVDVMKSACGVEYAEASASIWWIPVEGVNIPFASPQLLLRLKRTYRDKDALDRAFLVDYLQNPKTKKTPG